MTNPWRALKSAYRDWSREKFVGQSRHDKEAQKAFRDAIGKGKKIEVSGMKSARYKYEDDSNIYDPNEIAKMDEGDISKNVEEVSTDSTAIDSIKYDPETKVLQVKYRSGNEFYDFPDVPEEVVTEFLEAPSKGRYMAYYIMPKYSINRRK